MGAYGVVKPAWVRPGTAVATPAKVVEGKKEEVKQEAKKKMVSVFKNNDQLAVSMLELYEYLEVKIRFALWFKRMLAYLDEGTDFVSNLKQSTGGRPLTDYILSMDAAKEIAMLQKSPQGKAIRKYFIQVENDSRKPVEYYTVYDYCKKFNKWPSGSGEIAKKAALAKDLCSKDHLDIKLIPHPKYGFLHAFPKSVLDDAING